MLEEGIEGYIKATSIDDGHFVQVDMQHVRIVDIDGGTVKVEFSDGSRVNYATNHLVQRFHPDTSFTFSDTSINQT